MKNTRLSFNLFRLDNLVWVCKKAMKRRVNFIIPAGTSYAAELNFGDGHAEVVGKQKKVDELMSVASERAPCAPVGLFL